MPQAPAPGPVADGSRTASGYGAGTPGGPAPEQHGHGRPGPDRPQSGHERTPSAPQQTGIAPQQPGPGRQGGLDWLQQAEQALAEAQRRGATHHEEPEQQAFQGWFG